jgi:hypothetical protein
MYLVLILAHCIIVNSEKKLLVRGDQEVVCLNSSWMNQHVLIRFPFLSLFIYIFLFIYYFLFYKVSGVCYLMILFTKIVQCCWQINERVLVMDGMILIGKPKHLGINLCQCPFIQDQPWIDPCLCLERLATNHLNFGAACSYLVFHSLEMSKSLTYSKHGSVHFIRICQMTRYISFLSCIGNIKIAVSALVHESWELLSGCEIWYLWVWLKFFILLQFGVKLDNSNWHFPCMQT